jgi:hypothetical protein
MENQGAGKIRGPKGERGYTLVEYLIFLGILGGIGFFNWTQIKKGAEIHQEIASSGVIGRLEVAKNQFDSKSKPEDRAKFDRAQDSVRFEMLSPMMNNVTATLLVKGTGITEMKINRLGQDVTVERGGQTQP